MTKKKAKAVGRAQLGFSLPQELKDQIQDIVSHYNRQGVKMSVSEYIQRAVILYTNTIQDNLDDDDGEQ